MSLLLKKRKLLDLTVVYISFFFRGFSFLFLAPFLTRHIQPSIWGAVLSAQALGLWVTLVLDYGFTITLTRKIIAYENDKKKVAQYIGYVFSAKLLLLIPSILLVFLAQRYSILKDFPLFSILSIIWAACQSFSPLWYFQAKEKMLVYATIDIIFRFLYIILTLLFIKDSSKAYLVLGFQSLALGLSMIASLYLMFRELDEKISLSLSGAWLALKEGWIISAYTLITSVYTGASIFLLGTMLNSTQVAIYGNADRLVRAGLSLMAPINQIIVPRILRLLAENEEIANKFTKKISFIYVSAAISVYIAGYFMLPFAVHLIFGHKYVGSITIARGLLILFPLVALNTTLSAFFLIPKNFDAIVTITYTIVSIAAIGCMFLLVPRLGNIGMVYSVILPEFLALIVMSAYISFRRRL